MFARDGNEETFWEQQGPHLDTASRNTWTLSEERTHNARVAGGLRNGCWVQLNAIGVAKPPSLFVETHGTEQGSPANEIANVPNNEGNSPRAEDFSRYPSWTFDHSLVCPGLW